MWTGEVDLTRRKLTLPQVRYAKIASKLLWRKTERSEKESDTGLCRGGGLSLWWLRRPSLPLGSGSISS